MKTITGRMAHESGFTATDAADYAGEYYAAWWPAANAVESIARSEAECRAEVERIAAGSDIDCSELIIRRCTRRLYEYVDEHGGVVSWTVDDLGTADLR